MKNHNENEDYYQRNNLSNETDCDETIETTITLFFQCGISTRCVIVKSKYRRGKHRENTRDNANKEISDLINDVDCRLASCQVCYDRRDFSEKLPTTTTTNCK